MDELDDLLIDLQSATTQSQPFQPAYIITPNPPPTTPSLIAPPPEYEIYEAEVIFDEYFKTASVINSTAATPISINPISPTITKNEAVIPSVDNLEFELDDLVKSLDGFVNTPFLDNKSESGSNSSDKVKNDTKKTKFTTPSNTKPSTSEILEKTSDIQTKTPIPNHTSATKPSSPFASTQKPLKQQPNTQKPSKSPFAKSFSESQVQTPSPHTSDTPQQQCCICNNPIDMSGKCIFALQKYYHVEHFTCQGKGLKKRSKFKRQSSNFSNTPSTTTTVNSAMMMNQEKSEKQVCGRILANLKFMEKDGLLFCEDCYHDEFSPRCAYCMDPIKDKCISAIGKTFHPDHFFCCQCGTLLEPGKNFMEFEGKAYCDEDYQILFAHPCVKCGLPLDSDPICAMGKQFHKNCFKCVVTDCGKIFTATVSFYEVEGEPYCEDHYYIKTKAETCPTCRKPVIGRAINALGNITE
ncbi:hypothetical protein HK098_002158 [Nowakowskiella sp. JEL0407]|nr:hypothetical protein HK098_002158 [Nowakowskiella sp. JEL0407]